MFKLIKRIFIIVIVLLCYQFHPQILGALSYILISEENPEKSSAIVVMSGDDTAGSRVKKGVELFKKGYAPLLILSGSKIGWNTYATEIMKKQARLENIPKERIITLKSEADSTISEAYQILRFCRRRKLKKILIVTSDFHTRRTAFTFRHLLDSKDIEILVVGTKNIKFDPSQWWKKRLYAKTFFLELCKLIWYCTAENFIFKNNSKLEKSGTEEVSASLDKLYNSHFSTIPGASSRAYNPCIAPIS